MSVKYIFFRISSGAGIAPALRRCAPPARPHFSCEHSSQNTVDDLRKAAERDQRVQHSLTPDSQLDIPHVTELFEWWIEDGHVNQDCEQRKVMVGGTGLEPVTPCL